MNYDQFCKMERVANRAMNAVKGFADGEDKRLLNELTTTIAELRHAASTLCDGTSTEAERSAASARLHEMFSIEVSA